MATWIVHCRVGDYFLDRIPGLDKKLFAVGNVSPDCGYGKKDSLGKFTPPPRITHWSDTESKRNINAERFYGECLSKKDPNSREYSFYLGYYVHLMTDIRWTWETALPAKVKYRREFEDDPEYLKVMKVDWYDLDFKFIRDFGEPRCYELIQNAGKIARYFDYYEPDQLTKQVAFIASYYKNLQGRKDLDREYTFLTENAVDDFVKRACIEIEKILKIKNIL